MTHCVYPVSALSLSSPTAPSTIFLLGTGGAAGGTGPDGQNDKQWNGSSWAHVPDLFGLNSIFFSSACWDPTSLKFHFFGSTDTGTNAFSYEPVGQTWASIAAMPSTEGSGCAAAVGGIVYSFTGTTGNGQPVSNVVLAYRPAHNDYISRNNYPTTQCDTFCCPIGNFIYIGGGGNNLDGPGHPITCVANWYRYDPSADTYTTLASMPTALGAAACVAVTKDKILLVGGYVTGSGAGNGQTCGTTGVYEYTISTNSWATMNPYPVGVSEGCAAIWNGTIYVVGGCATAGYPTMLTQVYEYNVGPDSWSIHSSLPTNLAGSCAGYNGR